MHAKVYGDGPAVFLALHGWGGSHREFAPLAARRPAGATLHSVDLPGYGASPPPAAWTEQAVLAPLLDYTDRLPGDALTLVGFCSGAVVALVLAEQRPARVRRLVLIDPFAFVPWYFRLFLWGSFGRHAYATTFQSALGQRIANGVLRRRQRSDADFTASFRGLDHDAVRAYLALFHCVGPAARFAGLSAAVDLCWGERTFGAVRRSVGIFAAQWPQARTHQLHNVGHLPLVRGAAQLARIVFANERLGVDAA